MLSTLLALFAAPVPAEVDSDPLAEEIRRRLNLSEGYDATFGDWPHVPITTSERN